jgi:DNA-3-methyladenine glycosylase
MKITKLKRAFYDRPTLQVAGDLLGKLFVHEEDGLITGGRLAEVEAYIGEDDPACHASCGKTPRNEIMYGKPGFLYVYFTYGNHYLANIVTEQEGFPAAVLIRALEPVLGIDIMKKRRNVEKLEAIASGPGKLAQALAITTEQKGLDLTGSVVYILDDGKNAGNICCSKRIGIGENGGDRLWRLYIESNAHVSKAPGYIKKSAKPFREYCS